MSLRKFLVNKSLNLADPIFWKKSKIESLFYTALFNIYDQINNLIYRGNLPNKLKFFKNKYTGYRCFIIGNGPSLNKMDLSKLKNEYTFGLNRIYLLFPKIGFETTFYVSVNKHVIEQFSDDIDRINSTKFLISKYSKNIKDKKTILLKQLVRPQFSKNPNNGVWEGATVTYVAMQLAYWMGFSEIYLIGVDHNFVSKGPAHTLVTSKEKDPNHFDPSYFGKGVKWNLPDLKTSEHAYNMAKDVFDADNRLIYDATVKGKLNIFPKVKYQSLFER